MFKNVLLLIEILRLYGVWLSCCLIIYVTGFVCNLIWINRMWTENKNTNKLHLYMKKHFPSFIHAVNMYPHHHLPGWQIGCGSPHVLSSSPDSSPKDFYLLGHSKDGVLRLTLVIFNSYFKLNNRDFKWLLYIYIYI